MGKEKKKGREGRGWKGVQETEAATLLAIIRPLMITLYTNLV
jgi:hypothetical protein